MKYRDQAIKDVAEATGPIPRAVELVLDTWGNNHSFLAIAVAQRERVLELEDDLREALDAGTKSSH